MASHRSVLYDVMSLVDCVCILAVDANWQYIPRMRHVHSIFIQFIHSSSFAYHKAQCFLFLPRIVGFGRSCLFCALFLSFTGQIAVRTLEFGTYSVKCPNLFKLNMSIHANRFKLRTKFVCVCVRENHNILFLLLRFNDLQFERSVNVLCWIRADKWE